MLYGEGGSIVAKCDCESTMLVRLDPLTLAQGLRGPLLGDLGDFAPSPDHSVLAAGIGEKGDLELLNVRTLVDLRRTHVIARFKLGAASNGQGAIQDVAWLGPHRVFAEDVATGPTCCPTPHFAEVAVIDSLRHRLVMRRPLPGSPFVYRVVGDRAVILSMPWHGSGPAQLSVVSADGGLHSVSLTEIGAYSCCPVGSGPNEYVRQRQPGLAVDAAGDRAYVVGADEPIAVVDLHTLRVRYRPWPTVAGIPATTRTFPYVVGNTYPLAGPLRAAVWLGDGRLVVSGEDDLPPHWSSGQEITSVRPVGMEILDTRRWEARVVEPLATAFFAANGLVFPAVGASGVPSLHTGFTGYDADGKAVFRVLGRRAVASVSGPFGPLEYAWLSDGKVAILDMQHRNLLRVIRLPETGGEELFPVMGWASFGSG